MKRYNVACILSIDAETADEAVKRFNELHNFSGPMQFALLKKYNAEVTMAGDDVEEEEDE